MLLLQLPSSLTLLALDPFSFMQREHLLELDAELPAGDIAMIEPIDDLDRFSVGGEIGKRKAPEDSVVKMIVERVRQGELHTSHEVDQLLLFHCKRDVLDDDGRRDQLVLAIMVQVVRAERRIGQVGRPHRMEAALPELWGLIGRCHPALRTISLVVVGSMEVGITCGSWLRPRLLDFALVVAAKGMPLAGAKAFGFQDWAPSYANPPLCIPLLSPLAMVAPIRSKRVDSGI